MVHLDLPVDGTLQVPLQGGGDNGVIEDEAVHRVVVLHDVHPGQLGRVLELLRTDFGEALPTGHVRGELGGLRGGGEEHPGEPVAGEGLDVQRDHHQEPGGQTREAVGVVQRVVDLLAG